MRPLADRLREWGYEQGKENEHGRPHGWGFAWAVCEDTGTNYGSVMATLGLVTGYGRTTNEALNNLADGLIEHGWHDDRTPRCPDCEGTGMKPTGGYTWDGAVLYDGGTECPECKGSGVPA